MELRVLGPVEASADSESLALGGTKQRAVLAMLALDANRTVTADHLIEGLWGEDPPASAAKMVQNYVWRLRTVLGECTSAEILTRGRGYELRVDPDSVDVRRFQRLSAEAARAGAGGRAGRRRARGARAVARRRRWPTWSTRRSPRRRSGASRSCGSTPPSSRSTRT